MSHRRQTRSAILPQLRFARVKLAKKPRSRPRFRALRGELLEPRRVLAGTASIAGLVWNDVNGDGLLGASEAGIAGVSVYLDLNDNGSLTAGEPTATTGADGRYSFANLEAGNYVVREVVAQDRRITSPQASGQRLFALNSTTTPHTIHEVDPLTGAVMRTFAAPAGSGSFFTSSGVAFDGQTLYFMADSNDTLYRLNPNTGAVLGSTALPSGSYSSMAALGGKIYILQRFSSVVSIFDTTTSTVVGSYNVNSVTGGFNLRDSLGDSPGTNELLGSDAHYIAFMNPATGARVRTFGIAEWVDVVGVQALGNEIHVAHTGSTAGSIEVFTREGTLVRTLTLGFRPADTAGYADLSGSQRVSLAAGQALMNVNFGEQAALGSIRGTRWQDVNQNGVRDNGEEPVPGKTMYLDLNDNATRDANEPTAVTAADGSYVFSNVAAGNYAVRQEIAAGYAQTFPANTKDRLFVFSYVPGKIYELNPTTGAVLKTFNSPTSGYLDLAYDGKWLYGTSSFPYTIWKINPDTGAVAASAPLPQGTYAGLAYASGRLYSYSISDELTIIDPATLAIVGTLPIVNSAVGAYWDFGQTTNPDRILGLASFGTVIQINPATGVESLSFNLKDNSPNPTTGFGGKFYTLDFDGKVYVHSNTGVLLQTLITPGSNSIVGFAGTGGAQRIALAVGQNAAGLDFGTTEPAQPAPTLVTLAGGNVTIADVSAAGKDDQWRVELAGADVRITDLTGSNIDVVSIPGASGSGTPVVTVPLSVLQPSGRLTVDPREGNDTLTIDLGGGNPIPAGGIDYRGGNPTAAPGDRLIIDGGSQGTVTYNYTSSHSGSIVMSNYGTVSFTGLETMTQAGDAGDGGIL